LSHQPDLLPHHLAQLALEVDEAGGGRAHERRRQATGGALERRAGDPRQRPPGDELGHHVSRDAAEDRGLRHAVAPETVGSVDTARVLAGGEQPLDRGAAGGVDHDATHHEVSRRAHLDGSAREVAAEVAAALDHAAERRLDRLGAEVGDVDPDAALRRAAALDDLEERARPRARPASSLTSSTARPSSSAVMLGRAWACSASRFMISIPVRSPLWIVRSWLWPAKGFWWIRPSRVRSKRQPYRHSSSSARRGASVTSVQTSSWSLMKPPPASVSSRCASRESGPVRTAL